MYEPQGKYQCINLPCHVIHAVFNGEGTKFPANIHQLLGEDQLQYWTIIIYWSANFTYVLCVVEELNAAPAYENVGAVDHKKHQKINEKPHDE